VSSGGHGRTELLIEGGIVAILWLERDSDLAPAIEAIRDGGVTAIEILFAGPTAIQPLGSVSTRLRRGISLGIGGVLTPEAAREAIRAGAAFVVAPNLNPGVPAIPGAFTPTEILQAWKLGASLVKVFPAGPAGAGYVGEILRAVPEVRLVAAGGISLANVGEFIRAGAAAVGVDDEMVPGDALARRDFAEIARRTGAFAEAVQRARGIAARPSQPVRPIEGPDVR
jgi:2-dehydro-3-deoxyphosphogluconate aldolase/(4S)-4-hydroxy-2-oxoglutarate aldolase